MSSDLVRLDPRRVARVWIVREGPAWLVLARGHGWLHGDYNAALADALWLSKNLGLAVRRANHAEARQS